MAISSLVNATDLDVNVNNITTVGDLTVGGALNISGGLDFSFGDVNLIDLQIDGTSLSSGYKTCIELGTVPTDAVLFQGVSPSAVAMGFNGSTKSCRIWAGAKSGNQTATNWEDSSVTISDEMVVSVPALFNDRVGLNGPLVCSGVTIYGSMSCVGSAGFSNSVGINGPLSCSGVVNAGPLSCSEPALFSDTLTVDGSMSCFGIANDGDLIQNGNLLMPTPDNYIQTGTVALGPNPVNTADALDGGLANYLKLQIGKRDGKTWLYMIGSTEPTVNTPAITFGRIAAHKVYYATLQHPVRVPLSFGKSHHGLLVSSTGSYIAQPTVTEAHFHAELTDHANKSAVYGVLSEYDFVTGQSAKVESEDDWEQRYRDDQPQKTLGDKVGYVAQGGEGMIWCCDENGSIRNGDLLHVSSVPGMACRQNDDLYRTDTVFKATTSTDFRTEQTFTYPEYDYDGSGRRTVNPKGDDFTYSTQSGKAGEVCSVQIFNDRYEIYKGADTIAKIAYDFRTKAPTLNGRRYAAVLVGGLFKM